MDVEKAIALITAAGIELTDRRRTPDDKAWQLSFSNGALVEIQDAGKLSTSGNGIEAVQDALGLPTKPG
ncbi:MAG: hypothetical protein P0Y66_06150 [Candidatus Kaistia colombiensis]|nr:MAG: hypothetical protein P0Y66_06150 [Kaistia sp.]